MKKGTRKTVGKMALDSLHYYYAGQSFYYYIGYLFIIMLDSFFIMLYNFFIIMFESLFIVILERKKNCTASMSHRLVKNQKEDE